MTKPARYCVIGIMYTCINCITAINPLLSQAEDTARVGEPYKLRGNRLVFTNWIYVRPGDVGWVDSGGKSVYADKSAMIDQFGATWHPQDHMPWGVRLKAYKPSEIRIFTVEPEYPWEAGGTVTIGSVVWDDNVYKAWGGCRSGSCYFESGDGIVWKRPNLGLVDFQGSTENNLIPSAPRGKVFIDPDSKDEHYKCIFEMSGAVTFEQYQEYIKRYPDDWGPRALREVDGKPLIVCLGGAVSSDGFHWKELPEPVLMEHCDTDNIGYYDTGSRTYVAYIRTWNALTRDPDQPVGENTRDTWFPASRRSIGMSVSDDFRHFPRSEMILEPGPDRAPTDDIYTNCFTWIPRAPDIKLMFPAIWHRHDDTTTITMASSADGENWHWVPGGEQMIETGPFGSWYGGCIFAFPPLMELGNGDFALRFSAVDVPHKYPRGITRHETGIAIWPQGRIMAIVAPEKGEFATVAIVPTGTKLYINARTMRSGSICVAVKTGLRRSGFTMAHDWEAVMGSIIPGREFENAIPIIGDHTRALVRWKDAGDLGIKPGEPVVLLFRMEQAELFALEFE